MPKLVGALCALAALVAGILAKVDPVTCLWRAFLAYVVGLWATQLWYVFFTIRVQKLSELEEESEGEASNDQEPRSGQPVAEAS